MPSNNISLNRQQLAQFLPNAEAIKAFEQLFFNVKESIPTSLDDVQASADTAQQKAAEALSELANIANLLSSFLYGVYTEPILQDNYVLMNEYSKEDSFILQTEQVKEDAYIPPISLGSMAEQNANNVNITGGTISNARALYTFGVGGANPSNSGSGISFPSTQLDSTDPNTLDDYEEGTWTPNQGAGLTVVGAFSSTGKYTKIGRIVFVSGTYSGATSVAAVGGGVMSSNLPFTIGGVGTGALVNNSVSNSVNCIAFPGSAFFYSSGNIAATSTIHFSLIYTV